MSRAYRTISGEGAGISGSPKSEKKCTAVQNKGIVSDLLITVVGKKDTGDLWKMDFHTNSKYGKVVVSTLWRGILLSHPSIIGAGCFKNILYIRGKTNSPKNNKLLG